MEELPQPPSEGLDALLTSKTTAPPNETALRFQRWKVVDLFRNVSCLKKILTPSNPPQLPCLRSLSLARNPIRRIPWESIAHDTLFSSLTELDLAGTRIEEAEAASGLVHLSKTLRRVSDVSSQGLILKLAEPSLCLQESIWPSAETSLLSFS